MGDVEVRAPYVGIVQGTLLHDFEEYPHGARFQTTDPKLFAELRRLGALKLENELPEAAAQTITDQQAELANLRAQVAALESEKAEREAPTSKSSGGKASKAE